jgi:spore maturation protein CgeB
VPEAWDLSYLGTYSPDRQPTLERLLIEPARALPDRRLVVAGPQYPTEIDWPANVERIEHLPPAEHADFYSASRWTLNITRADMMRLGGRLRSACSRPQRCAIPVISDRWNGLDQLFLAGSEIVLADSSADVIDMLTDVSIRL